MKKLLKASLLSFVLLLTGIVSVGAISWSGEEVFIIPSWGAWSAATKTTKTKNTSCSYGYMEAIRDDTGLSKYGDFVKASATTTRVTKDYYKIHVNNLTKMHYTSSNASSKSLNIKVRASGENFEPSAGTAITAKFSAVN